MTNVYIIGASDQLDFARHLSLNYFREGKRQVLHANVPEALDRFGDCYSEVTEPKVMGIKEGHVKIEHDMPLAVQTLDWVISGRTCAFMHTLHTSGDVPNYEATRLFPHERASGAYRLITPASDDTVKNGLVQLAQQNKPVADVYLNEDVLVLLDHEDKHAQELAKFVQLFRKVRSASKPHLEIRSD